LRAARAPGALSSRSSRARAIGGRPNPVWAVTSAGSADVRLTRRPYYRLLVVIHHGVAPHSTVVHDSVVSYGVTRVRAIGGLSITDALRRVPLEGRGTAGHAAARCITKSGTFQGS
jgi:hypothetical protein